MSKIPSPLTLDLTNTRAFKTWLYDLWRSTGGDTSTAIEEIDLYLGTDSFDPAPINAAADSVLLMQIRDELAEINKKLDEQMIIGRPLENAFAESSEFSTTPVVTEMPDPHYPASQVEELSKRIDEIVVFLGMPAS